MVNSKRKGARGEREFAQFLRDHGLKDAHRGQQYNGLEGEDVVGLPRAHVEVKRVQRLSIHKAMDQSITDAEDWQIPIVAHRMNRTPWLITLRAEDFMKIYLKYLQTL